MTALTVSTENLAGFSGGAMLPENLAEFFPAIPDYENFSLLGRGVSGCVLRAVNKRLNREVALKLIAPDLASHPDAAERFFNEIRQTARLPHENIARGLDCGRAGKFFYYAMEFIRGESAAAKIRRLQTGKLKELETLQLARQAAAALHFTDQHGLLLFDWKPANWLIAENQRLKIADFGVAKDLAFVSSERYWLANAAYCAPEIAGGENLDIRSALYNFGCAWYEILTGAPPFAGDSPSAILVAQINEMPAMECDAKISPATWQLLQWLLCKDRAKRPRNAQQFIATLLTHPLLKIAALETDAAAEHAASDLSET